MPFFFFFVFFAAGALTWIVASAHTRYSIATTVELEDADLT